MALTVSALRSPTRQPPMPPGRTPERIKLAEAIEAKLAANERAASLRGAIESSERTVWEASSVVEACRADIATTQELALAHATAIANGVGGPAPRSVREAREALADSEDRLVACRNARDRLKREQMAEKDDVATCERKVREAASVVMKSEWRTQADALLAATVEQYKAMLVNAELVRQLQGVKVIGEINSAGQAIGLTEAVATLARSGFVPGCEQAIEAGATRFRSMFEGLQSDPDLPLP